MEADLHASLIDELLDPLLFEATDRDDIARTCVRLTRCLGVQWHGIAGQRKAFAPRVKVYDDVPDGFAAISYGANSPLGNKRVAQDAWRLSVRVVNPPADSNGPGLFALELRTLDLHDGSHPLFLRELRMARYLLHDWLSSKDSQYRLVAGRVPPYSEIC